ncbi:MAG: class I SAM-dependent methyltransferase [Bacteroidota bacterium]
MDNNVGIFTGERAQKYDSFIHAWVPHYEALQHYLPHLLAEQLPATDDPIVVVGCGTGNELQILSEGKPEWQLEGIDPSPEMIAQARQKLSDCPQISLHEGYMGDLPAAKVFRAATLLLVLHFIPDDGSKLKILQEIAQRLRPGAPLILLDIFGTDEQLQHNLQVLKIMLPSHLDPQKVAERIAALPRRIQYIPEERLAQLLAQSGFSPPLRFFQAAIYGAWISRKL